MVNGESSIKHPEPAGPGDLSNEKADGLLRIGVVQSVDADFEKLSEWTREAGRAGADLVVWPELSAAGIAAGGVCSFSSDIASAPEVSALPSFQV